MSLFSLLRLGESGTRAAQYGVNTASDNITNVNTPGYARRSVVQQTAATYRVGNQNIGSGVQTLSAQRTADEVLNQRVRRATAGASFADSRSTHLARAEVVFGDLNGVGLSPAIDRVFDSFARLAAAPQDATARSEVLASAQAFATEISRYGADLHDERLAMNGEVRDQVTAINRITNEIADLNRTIGSSDPKPNDLLDRRAQLLDDLASRVDINVLGLEDGQVSVSMQGGAPLVYETRSTPLQVVTNGDGFDEVHQIDAGADVNLTGQIRSGSLGGLLTARDDDLAAVETRLDQYAFDFANAVNTIHSGGYGVDGGTGRNLFTAPTQVQGAAAAFSIDASVAGNPDAIATATDPLLLPGDNRNAVALAALKDQASVGGQTPGAGFRGVLQEMGDRLSSASLSAESTALTRNQLTTMQSSLQGVSLDEEMTALMQFRTAYQAAAKVIQVADELLQETINLKR